MPTETAAAAVPVAGEDRRGRAHPRAGQCGAAGYRGAAAAGGAAADSRSTPAPLISSSIATARIGSRCRTRAASRSTSRAISPICGWNFGRSAAERRSWRGMSDNPFSEPEDTERTVDPPGPRRPARRAVRRTAAGSVRRAATRAPRRRAASPTDGAETISFGLNPLVAAAAPLLQLLGAAAQHAQPARPRRSARARGRADARVRAARARPRRAAGAAAAGALRAVRQPRRRRAEHALGQHRRVGGALAGLDLPPGGAQRRALLRAARPDAAEPRHVPAGHRADVSLPRRSASRAGTGCRRAARPSSTGCARTSTRSSCASGRRPTPRCRRIGRACRRPTGRRAPSCRSGSMAAAALAVIGGLFVWFSTSLNAASDDLFARLHRRPARTHAADRPRRAGAPAAARRRSRRSPIRSAPSSSRRSTRAWSPCSATAPTPIVRIRNRGMFASGSATVDAAAIVRLLERIGEALKAEKGPVQVIGYTDNQPIHTVQFPVQFPALRRARRGRTRDHRPARSAIPAAVAAEGTRRRRPDRPQRDTGGPRAEPAHRSRAAAAGLSHDAPCCASSAPAGS